MEQKEDGLTLVKRGKVHTLVSSKSRPKISEERAQKAQELQTEISRRAVLKGLVGVLALGAAYMLGKKAFGSSGRTKEIDTDNSAAEIQRFKNRAESVRSPTPPFEIITHDLSQIEKGVARSIVDEMRYEVLEKHSSFEGMMNVTRKFESYIRDAAKANNFPQDLSLGIVFIENGGAEDLTSEAGARGPAQLMPDTAREMGLVVDPDGVDERVDPNKCFAAMCGYLAKMRQLFDDDLGVAVWAYHAGPGNVAWAIDEFWKSPEGQALEEKKINVHRLLQNPQVRTNVISQLEDETELYPYKAVAAAEILQS